MKRVVGVLILFIGAIALLGYYSMRSPVEEAVPSLTIISPHTEGIRVEFGRAFAAWHEAMFGEPAKVKWFDQGGAADDLRYIRSEFARRPEGIGVDLFWGGGVEPYLALAEEGMLTPFRLPDELLSAIPREIGGFPMYDEKFRWYGVALSGFGVIYNKQMFTKMGLPPPKTWEDLCHPKLFGSVGSADPRHSGATHACYEIMLQAYGWERGFEVVTRLAANVKAFMDSSGEVPKRVALSDVAGGLAIDFYAWAQIAREGKEKLGYVLPQGLTVVNPDSIAILKGAPNMELARRFVTFVMSEPGQRLWILPLGVKGGPVEYELNRIPAVPEVFRKHKESSQVTFDPSEFRSSFKYDPAKGSLRYGILNDLLGALLIDTHDELVAAWRAILKAGKVEALSRSLGEPPLSEDELLSLARERWKDQIFRNEKIAEWTDFARRKYRRLKELCERP